MKPTHTRLARTQECALTHPVTRHTENKGTQTTSQPVEGVDATTIRAPPELSAHRANGIAADQAESKVYWAARRGGGGWRNRLGGGGALSTPLTGCDVLCV